MPSATQGSAVVAGTWRPHSKVALPMHERRHSSCQPGCDTTALLTSREAAHQRCGCTASGVPNNCDSCCTLGERPRQDADIAPPASTRDRASPHRVRLCKGGQGHTKNCNCISGAESGVWHGVACCCGEGGNRFFIKRGTNPPNPWVGNVGNGGNPLSPEWATLSAPIGERGITDPPFPPLPPPPRGRRHVVCPLHAHTPPRSSNTDATSC
jgi:hypothetical protein